MDILHVNKLAPPWVGGVEQHVHTLCTELARRDGVSVKLLACRPARDTTRYERTEYKLDLVPSLGMVWSMPFAPSLIPALGKMRCDIVHFHLPFPLGALAFALNRPLGRIFVTWHSEVVRQRIVEPIYRPFQAALLRSAERVVLTHPHESGLPAPLRQFTSKLVIIPMGIDTEWLIPTTEITRLAKDFRGQYGRRFVLHVGRFVYYKGLDYLLQAVPDVDARLVLVGTGPWARKLMMLTRQLRIADRVIFFGQASQVELAALYHACDLLVLPSVDVTEAYGLVQLEAMACGKPVVSTALPTGVPYVNRHGETGLIIPPRDSSALADAIKTLLGDESLRTRLGRQAQERVLQEFTSAKMADAHFRIYGT